MPSVKEKNHLAVIGFSPTGGHCPPKPGLFERIIITTKCRIPPSLHYGEASEGEGGPVGINSVDPVRFGIAIKTNSCGVIFILLQAIESKLSCLP